MKCEAWIHKQDVTPATFYSSCSSLDLVACLCGKLAVFYAKEPIRGRLEIVC